MNKIYKTVWNKARSMYMITSEIAKSHGRIVSAVVLATSMIFIGGIVSEAADTATGSGNGVAYGSDSNAPKAENVAIGKGAGISYSNGASNATGDIVVGNGAKIDNYASQGGSIAIGQNAKVENMAGTQERNFAFGQTTFSGYPYIPADPSKEPGGIAIGENTFARTGSLMIGTHNYKGKLGDIEVDSASTRSTGINVDATTIGTNSYNQGAFSTITGAYSIISGKYNGSNGSLYAGQNFGATITGSLNSIESATSSSVYAGVGNSIVGTANRTYNSNGSLVFGAGNEITNSITNINTPSSGGDSAKDLADQLRDSIKTSNSGGAALVIGGGNKVDYGQISQIIGVNNTLTGTSGSISKYNMLDGYKNTGKNINNVSIIGSENTVEETNSAILLGDKRKLSGTNKSIIIGAADTELVTDKEEVVILGHNANATVFGGVALGAGSIASIDKGIAGYDPSTGAASGDTSEVWKSTLASVSVGGNGQTRQITNVAAGTEDTDAVNVAQLKKIQAVAESAKTNITAGDNVAVEHDSGTNTYKISAKDTYTTAGTYDAATKKLKFTQNDASKNYDVDISGLVDSISGAADTGINFKGDSGSTLNKKRGETLDIKGGADAAKLTENNIGIVEKDGTLNVKLSKELKGLESVTTGDTTINNEGMTINNGPAMTKSKVDINNLVINNVGDGKVAEGSKDAVNGGQIYNIEKNLQDQITGNTQNIYNLGNQVGELGDRINKVGAGAAALAGLHPLDFDGEDKWDIAAGIGNYRNASAAAVGVFYRPNERTMLNVGFTMGDSRNMVNGGISVKLGRGSEYTKYSKVEMVRTIEAQSEEIAALKLKDAEREAREETREAQMKELMKRLDELQKQIGK